MSNRISPFSSPGVYGDVIRVKIMFNKKENALIQMSDGTQAQLGEHLPLLVVDQHIGLFDAGIAKYLRQGFNCLLCMNFFFPSHEPFEWTEIVWAGAAHHFIQTHDCSAAT